MKTKRSIWITFAYRNFFLILDYTNKTILWVWENSRLSCVNSSHYWCDWNIKSINSHHNMMLKGSRKVILFLSLNYLTRTMHWSIYLFICNGVKITGKLCRLMNRYASGCIFFSPFILRRNEEKPRREKDMTIFSFLLLPLWVSSLFFCCAEYRKILFHSVRWEKRGITSIYIVIEWTTNN